MIQQRKVATRSDNVLQKITKILQCMMSHPEGITPKAIALSTSINVNTIKSLLPKITGVKKIFRGFYRVVEGGDAPSFYAPDELDSWTFHNCILSYEINDDFTPISKEINIGIMTLSLIIGNTGTATLRIATDYPLNVSAISLCGLIFKMLLGIDVSMSKIYVKTIEFNKDYANLRLDGVKCITIDNLISQFKAYQKKRGLRLEHKTKVPMSVENVVDMLTSAPNTLELNCKLNEQMKKIERLSADSCKNTAILLKLLEAKENETERRTIY